MDSPAKPQSFFDLLNGKNGFWLGFVTAILVLGTLGFLILGSKLMGNDLLFGSARSGDSYAVNDAAVAPDTIPTEAVPVVTDDDHIRGDKNAPVTIIEYSDFECPFCQTFHPTMQQVMENYSGKVRWVYRHFPLSFHQQAQPSANAAECAGEQNQFWDYADELFANQSSLGESYYKQLAGDLGLNVSKWETCYDGLKYESKIQSQSQGGAAAGVTGTPGSFIIDQDGNAVPIKGALPYSSISAAIDQLLGT
ncbi:DsbA family protein [Candidatus Parcubacteria bacterium]|nr:DsbA family protein [Candidatus Parcubacteria bacterium]